MFEASNLDYEVSEPECAAGSAENDKSRLPRVALVVSHPIQHFCPQYASIAGLRCVEFKAFFASTIGAEAYKDAGLQETVQWTNLYLDEFDHEFLNKEPLLTTRDLDAPTLDKRLLEFSPDVIIVYGYSQRFSRRARMWAKNNGRLLYYVSDSETHRHEGFLRRGVKAIMLRRLFKSIDRFLSVGNSNEFYYVRHGVATHKITRMNFPIDVRSYERAFAQRNELRTATRAKLGCDRDTFVVVTVGKLMELKRQRDAIAAMPLLRSKLAAKLVVVGSGPLEKYLRHYADEVAPSQVQFVGFVLPDELPSYYAAADAYVQTSRFDRHSLAISEAIYMGLPVAISDTCGSYGPYDDVQPGRNGFVYPFGNVRRLADVLLEIASNPAQHMRFSEASRQYALEAQSRSHGLFIKEALSCDSLL